MTKPDIEIYTDGSGHVNGFGGWAAFIATPDRTHKDFRIGSANGTSVDRMEFTALLEGLQGAYEMLDRLLQSRFDDPKWKPNISWFTDRESLLNSVKRIYGRSNCLDLWARFQFYESRMIITGNFVTEEMVMKMPEFREVDLQSSTEYQQIKNYMTGLPFSPGFRI